MADRPVEVIAGVEGLTADVGPIFAVIGVFDGIHRGHQYLLDRLVEEAAARSARPAVVTFDSHPDEVILGAAPPLLLDPADRLRILGELGVEVVVVQHFDATLRTTEYDDFIGRITDRTRLAGLLMTPDAAFGHDRRGTPDAVAALGERVGFDLVVVPQLEIDGRSIRSSDIRGAIAAGDLVTAERLLGRPYAIVGSLDAEGVLRAAMPVALPPPGRYAASVDGDSAATLEVAGDKVRIVDGGRIGPIRIVLEAPVTA